MGLSGPSAGGDSRPSGEPRVGTTHSEPGTDWSVFEAVRQEPPDPILGVSVRFREDTRPHKVNLGVGMYYGDAGGLEATSAVMEAQRRVQAGAVPYLPVPGLPEYRKHTSRLLFGDNAAVLNSGNLVTAQTHGGGEALSIGMKFLVATGSDTGIVPQIAISDPYWDNHPEIAAHRGLTVAKLRYGHPVSKRLDFDGLVADLSAQPERSIALFQASGHNPTGIGLSQVQWRTVVDIMGERRLLPFFDVAYQGLVEGVDADVYAVRLCADLEIPMLVAQSGSKTFGLYGERVGALHVLAGSPVEAAAILSQLCRIIRREPSNCATQGALVVATVLGDPALSAQHFEELGAQRERLQTMRDAFITGVEAEGFDLSFAKAQRGMFLYGLPQELAEPLATNHAIYIVGNGRICVAGLNGGNISYVVDSVAAELRKLPAEQLGCLRAN